MAEGQLVPPEPSRSSHGSAIVATETQSAAPESPAALVSDVSSQSSQLPSAMRSGHYAQGLNSTVNAMPSTNVPDLALVDASSDTKSIVTCNGDTPGEIWGDIRAISALGIAGSSAEVRSKRVREVPKVRRRVARRDTLHESLTSRRLALAAGAAPPCKRAPSSGGPARRKKRRLSRQSSRRSSRAAPSGPRTTFVKPMRRPRPTQRPNAAAAVLRAAIRWIRRGGASHEDGI